MMKIENFNEDFPLLIEAGFVAAKLMDEKSARELFQAAQVLHPDSSAPKVGMGYIAMNKMNLEEASSIFEKVLEREPGNQLTRTFLGICYFLSKKESAGKKLIQEAMENSSDTAIQDLGKVSLNWIDKGAKAPFFKS